MSKHSAHKNAAAASKPAIMTMWNERDRDVRCRSFKFKINRPILSLISTYLWSGIFFSNTDNTTTWINSPNNTGHQISAESSLFSKSNQTKHTLKQTTHLPLPVGLKCNFSERSTRVFQWSLPHKQQSHVDELTYLETRETVCRRLRNQGDASDVSPTIRRSWLSEVLILLPLCFSSSIAKLAVRMLGAKHAHLLIARADTGSARMCTGWGKFRLELETRQKFRSFRL